MATKTFKVALSLDNPRLIQSGIDVRSFDKQSIKIAIELTKNSQTYQIPTGAQIKISLLKLARQEQKIILDVPFTSAEAIEWLVPDYLDGYQGEVRVGVYLIVGAENIDLGYFNITSKVSDIDKASEEFTDSVMQGWDQIEADLAEIRATITQVNTLASDFTTDVATKQADVTNKYNAFDESVTQANQTIDEILALQSQFQAVIDETTDKDVISAPEIILARNGKSNLKARLDEDHTQVTTQLSHIALLISNFKILDGEPDDTERFKRAINTLVELGGGKLLLEKENYMLNSFTVPDNIEIIGKGRKRPWETTGTVLTFVGTGNFITVNSYYTQKALIKNLNIRNSNKGAKNSTAIQVKLDSDLWGASCDIENISINGFGVGIKLQVTYHNTIKDVLVHECDVAYDYDPIVIGAQQVPENTFGNVNTMLRCSALNCDVGLKLVSNSLNNFDSCTFDQCGIAILTYREDGFYPPQQNIFSNCWFERITKYIICNSKIGENFIATGQNVASIPTIINARNDLNVFPEIPSHNVNYESYSITYARNLNRVPLDSRMDKFYELPETELANWRISKTGAERRIYKLSNKGLDVKMGLNSWETSKSYITTGATTQTLPINYSKIINPDDGTNRFSSHSIVGVCVKHNDGSFSSALFIASNMSQYGSMFVSQIGTTLTPTYINATIEINGLAGTFPADKTFNVVVTGPNIADIVVKINYLPNGLLF